MFIPRTLGSEVEKLMTWFPVVSVTGPRQSGKSTLLKNLFPHISYVNIETPGVNELATEDPIGFLKDRPTPLIIDEVQRAPELFSALQVISDDSGEPGQYVLSGSQNFLLADRISQTLAGRVGITHLLPLTFKETRHATPELTVEEFMIAGGYPRLHNVSIPPETYFDNYVRTYIERDVTGLLGVRDAHTFRAFLKLCAHQAGNLINYSGIANELDASFQTIKKWLSILQSSFIVFPLPAFHANSRKSLTKTPKLYFYDTGLLCHLLDVHSVEQLASSHYLGAVVENLVVSETAKQHLHHGTTPQLHFYRDDHRAEIDLIDSTLSPVHAYEIKASRTYNRKFGRHLHTVAGEIGIAADSRTILYRGSESSTANGLHITPIEDYLLR